MARLVYLDTGRDTLLKVTLFIAKASGYSDVARDFNRRIRQKCRALAEAPFPLGRLRPELRPDIRSLAVGNHVIFFRASPELVEIVAVVEGHLDLSAFFQDLPER
jgi:plasmid stabilization system protein ParE